jgi:hypothetical protein
MLKTKLCDQKIAFACNSMDKLRIYLISRWSGGDGRDDTITRSGADTALELNDLSNI